MENNFKNNFFIPDNKIDLILGKKEKEQKEILYCIFYYQNFSKLPEKISKNVEDLIKCIIKDLETIQKKKNAGRQGGLKKQENLQELKNIENENIDNKGMSNNSASSKILADNKQTSSTLDSKNLATPYKDKIRKEEDKYKIKEVEEKKEKEKEQLDDFITYEFCKQIYTKANCYEFNIVKFFNYYKDKGIKKADVESLMTKWDMRENSFKQQTQKKDEKISADTFFKQLGVSEQDLKEYSEFKKRSENV